MKKTSLGHYEHSKIVEQKQDVSTEKIPLKLVFLGAGSYFFERLFVDVLSVGAFESGTMTLVDIDPERLENARLIGEKINAEMGKSWQIKAYEDYSKALDGAQYIINCIEVNGMSAVRSDYEIPAKYGVHQCIGDTIGPGGIFKAMRTGPVLLDILRHVEEKCPNAIFLNYTNPMSILCLAAFRSSKVKFYGMCHSVQGTSDKLAGYLDVPADELRFRCGGVNHLAWFTELSHKGRDMYPLLFEKSKNDKETYEKDPVRFDFLHHFGYFVTESSGHFSEYIPYYRKRDDLMKKYCRDGYLGESGFYSRNWPQWRNSKQVDRREIIEGKKEVSTGRSWEYASYIIEAIEKNQNQIIYATVPNSNLIENISPLLAEVACCVSGNGIEPIYFGSLPEQCAALCESHLRVYELAARACIERSKEAALYALMLDPLTSAVCSPAETKDMFDELFESQTDLLEDFS